MENSQKIIYLKDLNKAKIKFIDKKTILVGGCFDILHYGHLRFLKKAKKEGDFLIVALESDEFIKKKKNKNPVHNQLQRGEILTSLSLIDLVILLPYFSSDTDYFNLVKEIRPKIIAVTERDPQLINKKNQAKEVGGKLTVVTSYIKDFSTRKIIDKYQVKFL